MSTARKPSDKYAPRSASRFFGTPSVYSHLQKNILDATLRVFDQKGLKFTMDDLAKPQLLIPLQLSVNTVLTGRAFSHNVKNLSHMSPLLHMRYYTRSAP
jgi:hypothetical protein